VISITIDDTVRDLIKKDMPHFEPLLESYSHKYSNWIEIGLVQCLQHIKQTYGDAPYEFYKNRLSEINENLVKQRYDKNNG
jgi:hypothetical protein